LFKTKAAGLLQCKALHEDVSAAALPSYSRCSHWMLWCNDCDVLIFGKSSIWSMTLAVLTRIFMVLLSSSWQIVGWYLKSVIFKGTQKKEKLQNVKETW